MTAEYSPLDSLRYVYADVADSFESILDGIDALPRREDPDPAAAEAAAEDLIYRLEQLQRRIFAELAVHTTGPDDRSTYGDGRAVVTAHHHCGGGWLFEKVWHPAPDHPGNARCEFDAPPEHLGEGGKLIVVADQHLDSVSGEDVEL